MAASAWLIHDAIKEYWGNKVADMDTDTFNCSLSTTANATAHTAASNARTDVTNQVANGSGYTTGGVALTGVVWSRSSGTVTWDSNDPSWTASGGTITARYAYITDETVAAPVADPIVVSSDLDAASISVTTGNTLTIQMNASGIFTLA